MKTSSPRAAPGGPPVDPLRSRMMAAVRGKDTKPEMAVRRHLHAAGLRYALHRKDLPGTPDIVLRKHRAVVLVHGCFWHGHDCRAGRIPSTRTEWWSAKIAANRARDGRTRDRLAELGWRVFEVWECGIKDAARLDDLVGRIRGGPDAAGDGERPRP